MGKSRSFTVNLSWIFVENLAHASVSFLLNIVVARTLSISDFGIINYAAAWIAFFYSIASLGINSVINKFTTENTTRSNKYLCSAIFSRIISAFISIIAVAITVLVMNARDPTTFWVSIIQSSIILFAVGDTLVFWFRYHHQAKTVATLRMISFVFSALIRIIAILIFHNIYIYTVGLVAEAAFFSFLLIFQYRNMYTKKIDISFHKSTEILKSSYPFIFSAILATIYAQTDRIMIKSLMGNAEVAYYSIALTVAGIMSIVVGAVTEGFRAEIFKCLKTNREKYFLRFRQIYAIAFWICIIYGIFVTLFAKQILSILYGSKYIEASNCLALVVWYTSFSYLGTINNIYMVAENKEKWVQITTLSGAAFNVLLNFVLIPRIGINGAALSSLITQFLANFLMLLIIKDLRPIVPHILKGITLYNVFPVREILTRLTIKKSV